ncbi:type IV toxin-antitoxin system AbiEi family antitoxin [Cellulophaga sp. F20128]|uniref:type IV toxin-antitoxin system AbiEi family antitoxin n=1 Tax=Cellulophaga sp. F20128 TaxID=2926413 RepID=UPI001FF41199|nr:type IV toxin-antitoxin system AbiEi family antitoxin [Cellulophaga sp. F20128]MCK0157264.1 type IV toxin-antitoxin system AbiEi family antitoxin [Cellulophaga sp. F20128]
MGKEQKINQLLSAQPSGAVYLSSWLTENGFSTQLLNRYKKSNWLYSLGTGAWMRVGENPTYEGAIYALQQQAESSVHIGGKTALSLLGKAHYLELSTQQIILFGGHKEKLPAWFTAYNWKVKINYFSSSFLPAKSGLQTLEQRNFSLQISNPIRALLECLYLAPKKQKLVECYEIMEGLNNLRPKHVQDLLEQCTSIKVKRLFLYMAEKVNHDWFTYIDVAKIDIGKGKRSLVKDGVYIAAYGITVPKALAEYE